MTTALQRYAFAVVVVALSGLLTTLSEPLLEQSPFLLFVAAVAASVWYGGMGPGLVTTGLATIAGYFMIRPVGELVLTGGDVIRLAVFVLVALFVSALRAQVRSTRARAESTAREWLAAEERYRRIVETTKEGVWVLDPAMRTEYVNPRMAEMLGYEPAEMLGRPVSDFINEADREAAETDLRRRRAGLLEQHDFRFRRRDGSELWALVSASPITGPDGELLGSLKMVTDVTQRRRAEAALRESEERFRIMADTAPVMLWMAGVDGRGTFFNKPLLEFTGRTREDEVQYGWTEGLHPDDYERCHDIYRAAFEARRPFQLEYRLRRADGEYRWVLDTGHPRFDAHGTFAGYIGSTIDITERKQAEEQRTRLLTLERVARAQAEDAERRAALLAAASAILASSMDYSSTLTQLARLAVPDLGDWCLIDLVELDGSLRRVALAHPAAASPDLVQAVERHFPPDRERVPPAAQALRTAEPALAREIPDEILVLSARAPEHLLLLRGEGFCACLCVPFVARGRSLGLVTLLSVESGHRYDAGDLALVQDVARRAALAIDNARLYEEAQAANRMKDEFLATVSHELRTPLTSMLGWVQLLRTRRLDEATTARGLELVERNTRIQARLIEDLLDISRIIMGKLRLDVRPVDLVPVIEAAVDAVRPAAAAKSIHLERSLDPDVGPVAGDPGRLQQILWNLLSNAVKFTPEEGQVEVRLERADGRARLRVADTGKGISSEFLPHVFDRFRQADGSTTRGYGGLGVGLAIVRHLVELHGGTVRAESAGESRGTAFIVDLPLAAERSPDDGSLADRETAAAPELGAALRGLRVLVVDDEEDAREMLATVLAQAGAEVTATASTAEALEALERSVPDVLVSDLAMPGEDGFVLIRKVRARGSERGGGIPAAAVTAYAGDEDRTRALQAGFQTYVAKPVEAAELVWVVSRLAARRRKLAGDLAG